MARRIIVRIRRDGKAIVDFDGFVGEECFLEHEKLQQILAKYGVNEKPEQVVEKPEAAVAASAEQKQATGW